MFHTGWDHLVIGKHLKVWTKALKKKCERREIWDYESLIFFLVKWKSKASDILFNLIMSNLFLPNNT